MLKIHQIMNHDVFTVSSAAPVQEVAWALAIRNVSGAPVRDARGRLVGMVTKRDLADPTRGVWPCRAGAPQTLTAQDVMTAEVTLARAADPAMTAVHLLAGDRTGQLIVVDGDGDVVGMVTPMDVLRALVHGDPFVENRPRAERPDDAWERKATAQP